MGRAGGALQETRDCSDACLRFNDVTTAAGPMSRGRRKDNLLRRAVPDESIGRGAVILATPNALLYEGQPVDGHGGFGTDAGRFIRLPKPPFGRKQKSGPICLRS